MAKDKERVNMYNRGKRTWTLKDNGVDKFCAPGRFIELNKNQAEKMVKSYPKEFIIGDGVKGGESVIALKTEIKKLKAANAEQAKNLEAAKGGLDRLEELEAENADLKKELEAKNAEIEKLRGPVTNTEQVNQ